MKKYNISIKKEAPYGTKTRYFINKAEAFNYLYKEGYEKWYIKRKARSFTS